MVAWTPGVLCHECGSLMVRDGDVHRCPICGAKASNETVPEPPAKPPIVSFISLDAALAEIDAFAAAYPIDLFPEDGFSVDANSAKMARHVCAVLKERLVALAGGRR